MKGFGFRFCLVSIWLMLTACSTIKSWFPDKERDYQFRSEIAPLNIPDDLKSKSSSTLPLPLSRTPQQLAGEAISVANEQVKKIQKTEPAEAKNSSDTLTTKQNTPASAAGVSSLMIDQGRDQAWRMVGKALTQQKFEIVDRNQDLGHFYIRFASKENENIYASAWEDIKFIFGDFDENQDEFRIRLNEISALSTEVTVEDVHGKVLSSQVANQILKLITEGINGTNASGSSQQNQ
jgi:outer membrane protein assembly factor BamC